MSAPFSACYKVNYPSSSEAMAFALFVSGSPFRVDFDVSSLTLQVFTNI